MAIQQAESTFGTRAVPLRLHTDELVDGGLMVRASVPDAYGGSHRTLETVAENQERFAALGAFLFVVRHGIAPIEGESSGAKYSDNGHPDVVALLPTTDKFEVVRRVGTDGNLRHSASEVLAWLRELDRAQPYVLIGAGVDFVEGYFLSAARDPVALARNVYAFCPDFWDQGLGLASATPSGEEGLAAYFETERYFFFWWD